MVTLDRIRLTGLLRKKPWKRGFFYGSDSPATHQARPAAGVTAVSVEPLGAVARRRLLGCAGYEPLRRADANTTRGLSANPSGRRVRSKHELQSLASQNARRGDARVEN